MRETGLESEGERHHPRTEIIKFEIYLYPLLKTKEVFETKRTILVYYLQNEPKCGLFKHQRPSYAPKFCCDTF